MTSNPNGKKIAGTMDEMEKSVEQTKETIADKIVRFGTDNIILFQTPDEVVYAAESLESGGVSVYPIASRHFNRLINYRYNAATNKVPSAASLGDAIKAIEAKACVLGDVIELHNRVAWGGGGIVYDMSNENRDCVTITPEGWDMQPNEDIIFKQWSHQVPQTDPVHGGDIDKIFEVANINDDEKLIFKVHLVTSLIPGIPHPIPNIYGEHGSAKSSVSRYMKLLIDPSVLENTNMPGDEKSFVRALSKHWYIIFDNVSWIKDWQSDVICKAVTGQATTYRVLYSDDDDMIYKHKMCCGMNGITYTPRNADLIDRSFTIHLPVISGEDREGEEMVNDLFSKNRGEIFGGILDALSKTLAIYPTIELDELPRMADFAKYGAAAAIALGYTAEEFLDTYNGQIEENNLVALERNPVPNLIMSFMSDQEVWMGTATELFNELHLIAGDGHTPVKEGTIKGMSSTAALGTLRDRLAPNLRKVGIDWTFARGSKGRIHTLKSIDEVINNG